MIASMWTGYGHVHHAFELLSSFLYHFNCNSIESGESSEVIDCYYYYRTTNTCSRPERCLIRSTLRWMVMPE